MTTPSRFLKNPYGGYLQPPTPSENAELTHVERGSTAGELLRRYWQPVALSSDVSELPHAVRMFGEDLVVFRTTAGEVGLLDRHCSHRGTSLEYGIPTDGGIRCCYHGWLFGVDGRVLETPGDPPTNALKDKLCHPAYPVHEYKGLIFGYFGPPNTKSDFPVYDSFEHPGDRMVPYYVEYPCNWLQVHENVMDPAHGVFLHTRITFTQFADAWGEMPDMAFIETPTGMIYITTRRWEDKIWVRSADIILPNLAQVGHIWKTVRNPRNLPGLRLPAGRSPSTIPIAESWVGAISTRTSIPGVLATRRRAARVPSTSSVRSAIGPTRSASDCPAITMPRFPSARSQFTISSI